MAPVAPPCAKTIPVKTTRKRLVAIIFQREFILPPIGRLSVAHSPFKTVDRPSGDRKSAANADISRSFVHVQELCIRIANANSAKKNYLWGEFARSNSEGCSHAVGRAAPQSTKRREYSLRAKDLIFHCLRRHLRGLAAGHGLSHNQPPRFHANLRQMQPEPARAQHRCQSANRNRAGCT